MLFSELTVQWFLQVHNGCIFVFINIFHQSYHSLSLNVSWGVWIACMCTAWVSLHFSASLVCVFAWRQAYLLFVADDSVLSARDRGLGLFLPPSLPLPASRPPWKRLTVNGRGCWRKWRCFDRWCLPERVSVVFWSWGFVFQCVFSTPWVPRRSCSCSLENLLHQVCLFCFISLIMQQPKVY